MDQLHDDRGQTETADERKLPVLFHLMDVSRPREVKLPVKPEDLAADPLSASISGELRLEPPAVAFPPSPEFTPLAFPTNIEPQEDAFLSLAASESSPSLEAASSDLHDEAPAEPPPPETLPTAAIETTPAAAAEPEGELPPQDKPVTLPPERHSGRRPQKAAADDWFASHGKFIAIAFVVALAGTVYLARTTRPPAPEQEETVRPVAPLIELASAAPQGNPSHAPATAKAAPPLVTASAPAASAAAPPATGATVELHMPTSPATQVAATSEQQTPKDSLFVFPAAKTDSERVAARPPSPPSAAPPLAAASQPQAASLAPSYPVTAAPQFQTAAPQFQTAGPHFQPAAPYAQASAQQQAGYPQTASAPLAAGNVPAAQGMMPPPPGPPLPWAATAGGYASTPAYQPPENVARGPRYERTGSGNY